MSKSKVIKNELNLMSNIADDIIGYILTYLPTKEVMNFSSVCKKSYSFVHSFVTKLDTTNLVDAKIVEDPYQYLASITKPSIVYRITDAGISSLTNLTYLIIARNDQITDAGISGLTNLCTLYLRYLNLVTDAGISSLTNLTYLDLSSTEITNAGISSLTNLTYLDLFSNKQITNEGISGLTSLMDQEIVDPDIVPYV